jgi:hypothetical protein
MKINRSYFWGLLILAIPLFAGMAGCKKFLDRKPLQSTLDDLNQGALEGQIFAIYNILRTNSGFSELVWLDFHSIRDDDAQKGSDANDGKEIVTEFETFQYAKDDWAPNTYWNDHYSMINAANNALHTADSLKVTDPASLRNVGEALFFRAYSYFELVKTYGEVPLINYKIVNPSDGIRAKTTVALLYAFIDSNLQAAVQLLPLHSEEYGPGFDGRITRGSANTLWRNPTCSARTGVVLPVFAMRSSHQMYIHLHLISRTSGKMVWMVPARTDLNPFLKHNQMLDKTDRAIQRWIMETSGVPASR